VRELVDKHPTGFAHDVLRRIQVNWNGPGPVISHNDVYALLTAFGIYTATINVEEIFIFGISVPHWGVLFSVGIAAITFFKIVGLFWVLKKLGSFIKKLF
jgi:hypothetical protein